MWGCLCAPSPLLCITSIKKGLFPVWTWPGKQGEAKGHLWVPVNQSERLPSNQDKISNQSHSESPNLCQSSNSPLTLKPCIKIKWLLIGPFRTAPITAALHRDHSSVFRRKSGVGSARWRSNRGQMELRNIFTVKGTSFEGHIELKIALALRCTWTMWWDFIFVSECSSGTGTWPKAPTLSYCYKSYKHVSASIVDNRSLSGYRMNAVHEGRSCIKI